MSRPRLSHRRHPMFEPHEPDHSWWMLAAGIFFGAVMGVALAYAMAAQP